MRVRSISLAAIICLLLTGLAAWADDVHVSATVSDDSAQVGDTVDYTIKVDGAGDASVPENIDVDGLQVTYSGHQFQFSVNFGSTARSVVHTYSVVPSREGDFVIPPQQVVVDGKTYMTKQVTLHVGGEPAGGGAGAAGGANAPLYFSEFVLPRDTAYIGEALPLEVRLYVDARVRARLEELPEITAEGCTVQKIAKPTQSQVERFGRTYIMVTYKTALTPATTGKVKLGPATVQAVAQLPQSRPRRRGNSPFDDPMFQNPFFSDPFQMLGQQQEISIRAEPVELKVKSLPTQGEPRSFGGAVGNFTMTTDVKPTMVEAGDPITITAKISGRGDFDRVTVPEIKGQDGWKVYPPSAKFQGDDDIGISGAKVFQMAVIPQVNKTESPSMEWSYFDPDKEQYVTLTGKALPIKIEGEPAAAPVIAQNSAAPKATPTPSAPDILYIRADSAGWGETFQPLYMNRIFWAAQGAPLLALLGFAGMQVARRRAADEKARRIAQWRRERDAELARMQRRDAPESELYQAAAKALRLEAAIQTGREPDTLDAGEVAGARVLDEPLAQRVRQLFDHQAEVLYAGTSAGRGAASAQTRAEAMETVKGYENAKPAI